MTSYTQKDELDVNRFVDANEKAREIKKMLEKAPHLASWLDIKITNDLPDVPAPLKKYARKIDVKITQKLCEDGLSCNAYKETEVCRPDEPASYYYIGDDQIGVQCQPSCFNTSLIKNSTANAKNNNNDAHVDVPMLHYHKEEEKCIVMNSQMITFLEKPFYRSSVKYEVRVNDMPTGFSRITNTDPTTSGWDYVNNETYCNYFDKSLAADKSCTESTWEKGVGLLIGTALINSAKSGIRTITGNKYPFKLPTGLPAKPKTLDVKHTVAGWKADINKDFVLPKIIDYWQETATTTTSTTTGNDNDDDDDNNNAKSNKRKRSEIENIYDEQPRKRTKRATIPPDIPGEFIPMHQQFIFQQMIKMSQYLAEPKTLKKMWATTKAVGKSIPSVAAFVATDLALRRMRSLALKVSERLSAKIAGGAFEIEGEFGARVVAFGIESITKRLVISEAMKVGAQLALMSAKLLASTATVVLVFLAIAQILDIILAYWDPFNYNKMLPADIGTTLMRQGEEALRKIGRTDNVEFTYDMLKNLLLTTDEQIEIALSGLPDRLFYLNTLTVNAEGSVIDKGEPFINLSAGDAEIAHLALQHVLARRFRFDQFQYNEYNRTFINRIRIDSLLCKIATAAAALSVGCLLFKFHVLCIVFLVITLILLAFKFLNVQNTTFVSFMSSFQFKDPSKYRDSVGYELSS